MVLPFAVDLQETQRHALIAQSELLGDPSAGPIPRDDRYLDAMKAERLEGKLQDDDHGLWRKAEPGHILIDPVADRPVLERAPSGSTTG